MKKLENTNGVTLIVLVITIVVLLILAAVSISLLSGENGIIAKAQKVSEDAKRVEIIEVVKTAIAAKEAENPDNPLTLDQIEDVLNEHGTVNKTENGVLKSFTSDEIEIPIKEFIEDDMELALSDLAIPSYYVEYNDSLWQVLYNDAENGLQIILADVGEEFTVTPDNYNDVVDLLNEACQKYINTEFAYAARSVGSNPIISKDLVTEIISLGIVGRSDYIETKVGDDNYLSDISAMEENNIENIEKEYWLASREVTYNSSKYWSLYCDARYVRNDGTTSAKLIQFKRSLLPDETGYYGKEEFHDETLPIRPVVTLKSSVMIGSGDGTKDNPFTLSK